MMSAVLSMKLDPLVSAYKAKAFENPSVAFGDGAFVISGEGGGVKKSLAIQNRGLLRDAVLLLPDLVFNLVINSWINEKDPLFDYTDITAMVLDVEGGDADAEDIIRSVTESFAEAFRIDAEQWKAIAKVRLLKDDTSCSVRADFTYGVLGVSQSVTVAVNNSGELAKYVTLALAAGYNDFLLERESRAAICFAAVEAARCGFHIAELIPNEEGLAAVFFREGAGNKRFAAGFIPADPEDDPGKIADAARASAETLHFTDEGTAALCLLYALSNSAAPDADFVSDAGTFALRGLEDMVWQAKDFLADRAGRPR